MSNISSQAGYNDLSGIRQIGDAIIRKAVRAESSDIHITPKQDYSLIRFRISGELSSPIKIPSALHEQVLEYFELLASPESDTEEFEENDVFQVKIGNNLYNLGTETYNTEFGDSIIIHMSLNNTINVGISSMGLNATLRHKVCEAIEGKSGVVILSGPFASGKTTSMYAFLNHLVQQGKKVLTIEHEIKMQLPNIIQISTQGLTGKNLLTEKIKQRIHDEKPDVIMLYRLDHAETAQEAFKLAQHGTMILASMRSSDATATIAQLGKFGLNQETISEELKLVLNQRLLRQLCSRCHEEVSLTADILARFDLDSDTKVHKSLGCHSCMNTGYSGRLPVHEAILVTDDIGTMIRNNATEIDLRHASRESGMLSIFEDAMSKALNGKLSFEDILRDLPKPSNEGSIGHRLQCKPASIQIDTPPSPHKPLTSTAQKNTTPTSEFITKPENSTKATVLLVEDSQTMRDYIGYILRNSGQYEVIDVSTAEEALEILFQNRPSMIVTDQILPGMNGTSLIATVRSTPKMADIPMVLLTSEEKMEVEALKTGADSYIAKPVDPDLLLARVGAVFATYQRMKSRPL